MWRHLREFRSYKLKNRAQAKLFIILILRLAFSIKCGLSKSRAFKLNLDFRAFFMIASSTIASKPPTPRSKPSYTVRLHYTALSQHSPSQGSPIAIVSSGYEQQNPKVRAANLIFFNAHKRLKIK
jgi:hypothetical protein